MMSCTKNKLFQTGVLCGFINKIYQGDLTLADIMKKGDFGIGTFDEVHGELIGFDGKFYRVTEDGAAHLVDLKQKSPFAWVVDFEETQQFLLEDIDSFKSFEKAFFKQIPSLNYIYAYRFETTFEKMMCRSEPGQPKPYRPLSDTLPKLQVNFSYGTTQGTVAGFYFPNYFSMLNIPGCHMHFLDEKNMRGGHVFDFSFKKAIVKVCCIKNYELALIQSEAFAANDIYSENLEHAVKAVEKA